ncbi:MAG: hypothetical protein PHT60_06095 [Acidiphilium sp.]|nr:hypothetical protein [Acidiphilium sp.]
MAFLFCRVMACRLITLTTIGVGLAGALVIVQPAFARPFVARNQSSFWFRVLIPNDQVPTQIGHASFRLGQDAILVFAADLPVDQSVLQQITGAPNASVVHLSHATILRIPLPPSKSLYAVAAVNSFHVVLGSLHPAVPVNLAFVAGKILFSATAAGPVVTLANPGPRSSLLVGTVMNDAALDHELQGPGYTTIPATSGVVVAPTSDDLELIPATTGFVLQSVAQVEPLPVGHPPVAGNLFAGSLHKGELDLPLGTIVVLRHRMESAQRRVAMAPPLDRFDAVLHLARILLALDLGPEAHGVLMDMLRSDPAAIDNPQRRALLAISDVVSYRPDAITSDWSALASDPDQESLWRGLADAERGNTAKAADLLSGGLSSLVAAPPLVRAQMLPLATETLIAGGKLALAQRLLQIMPQGDNLALARAEVLQATHHPRAALKAFDRLLADSDPRVAGIARFRSVMLRWQLHQLDARAASALLGRYVYEWRSTRHELNVRLALANLRAQAQEWPLALMGLIRTDQLFPKQEARIFAARQALFTQMIASGALDRLEPLAAVSVIQNNTDLIPPGNAGVPILQVLSKHLVALGLPDPAASIMEQLIVRAPDDESRAQLGLGLAQIDVDAHHLGRAQTALSETSAPDIASNLAASRQLLEDEIAAKNGIKTGLSSLTASTSPRVLGLAAQLASDSHDWPALETAAQKLAATVPPVGPLDRKAARSILQWAVAASHARDFRKLAALRTKYESRMPPGRDADLFETITGPPVTPKTSLSAALDQIAAIERVGKAIGPAFPQRK